MPDDQSSVLSPGESQALTEGQRLFGKYVLKGFLSRGPLGAAWLVMDESIGREMAMRFLPAGWARDEQIKQALQRALGRWRELAHPHIVTAQNAVSDGMHAAIITRFVDAETLHELKSREDDRSFAVSRLAPWMAQLCDALDYAWRHHQMIHGDLNPLNLLITKDDSLRVADFGLARSLFDVEGPDGAPILVGTLAYISPERAKGAEVTIADDVYSFGATVFDALTSRPPFFRGNILWQLESVVPPTMTDRKEELAIGGEPIPPEWEEVVAACLAKKPGDRPQSVREIGERLGLLEPLPPSDTASHAAFFPKARDESIPEPRRSTEPIEIYPTSMPTAGMEPMTMAGVSESPSYTAASDDANGATPADPQPAQANEESPQAASVQRSAVVPEARPSEMKESGLNLQPQRAKPPATSEALVSASQVPTAAAPPEPEPEFATMQSHGKAAEPLPRPEPSADASEKAEAVKSESVSGSAETGAKQPLPPPPEALPTPEPVVTAPPPSVVAIPPMDPGLERTFADVSKVPASPPPAPLAVISPAPAVSAPPSALPSVPPPPNPQASPNPAPPAPSIAPAAPAPPVPAAAATPPPPAPSASSVPATPPSSLSPSLSSGRSPSPTRLIPSPEDTDVRGANMRSYAPHAFKGPPPSSGPEATSVPPPSSSSQSNMLWIAGTAVVAVVVVLGAILYFKSPGGDQRQVAASGTPRALPTAAPPPIVAPPVSQPPATGRTLPLTDASTLADKGRLTERVLLTGQVKVVSAQTPTSAGVPSSAILRPADAKLSGTTRITATYPAGLALPKEGSVLEWNAASKSLVREVTRGGDGQLNVTVDVERP